MMRYNSVFLFLISTLLVQGFRKVIVPAVYKEFEKGFPSWIIDEEFKASKGYEVFLYQRLYPENPNYVRNRGTEGTIYLRYIVDHYDDFPDFAVFVHADPKNHQLHWLEFVECIHPNATYSDINFIYFSRSPSVWQNLGIWMEQCWRDTLKLIYDDSDDTHYQRFPLKKPLEVTFPCCQQFFVSRSQIHRRPYSFWRKLLHIFNEQDVCHEAEPNYTQLHAYVYESPYVVGPEPTEIPFYITNNRHFHGDRPNEGYGRYIQGLTLEHFAHMIYGGLEIQTSKPTPEMMCTQFLSTAYPQCPHSPCKQESSSSIQIEEKELSTTTKSATGASRSAPLVSATTLVTTSLSKIQHQTSFPTTTTTYSMNNRNSSLSSPMASHSSVAMFHSSSHISATVGGQQQGQQQQQEQQHPIQHHIHSHHQQKQFATRSSHQQHQVAHRRRTTNLRSSASSVAGAAASSDPADAVST